MRVEAINRNRVKLQVHFNCAVKPTEIIQQTALLTANPLKAGFQVLDGLLRLGCLRFLLVVVNVVFDLGLTERCGGRRRRRQGTQQGCRIVVNNAPMLMGIMLLTVLVHSEWLR